jgi:methionyl aminopeptidase
MAQVVEEVMSLAAPGVSSMDLEAAARAATARLDATPSYLGYKTKGEKKYPAALCVSINNDIAHSPPTPKKILRAGDVVSIDFGLSYKGLFMDTAQTVVIGQADAKAQNLLQGTEEALAAGIAAARVGAHIGDIGAAVAAVAKKYKLGIVKDLRGHGVGAAVHEDPFVPNFGKEGEGEEIAEGLVIAIEPIFAEGSGAMVDAGDGFTYSTRDGSRAAHFEHTILVTKNGPEILTQ